MNNHSLDSLTTFLTEWLAFRAAQIDVPGISVAIHCNGRVIFSGAYGYANLSKRETLTPRHRFAVGSQSKMFASSAILLLAEQKKLRLEDTVISHLPWLAAHPNPKAKQITIKQILSHTSGFSREGMDADYWQSSHPFPGTRSLQKLILGCPIPKAPRRLHYSNLGYALTGQIVRAVSGDPYDLFVTSNLIVPLGLSETSLRRPDQLPHATGYTPPYFRKRHPLHAPARTHAFAPVTGVWATPSDMCRFVTALFGSEASPLSKRSQQHMQTTHAKASAGLYKGMEFGLGAEIVKPPKRRLVGHSGHMLGQNSATYFDAATGWTVSVAVNCREVSGQQIALGIFEAMDFFAQNADQATPQKMNRFAAQTTNKFANVDIIPTAKAIVAIDPDDWQPFGWADKLEYVSPTTLKVVTKGNIFNEDELIEYTFKDKQFVSLRFSGITLERRLPPQSNKKVA